MLHGPPVALPVSVSSPEHIHRIHPSAGVDAPKDIEKDVADPLIYCCAVPSMSTLAILTPLVEQSKCLEEV